ncbi:hypothetical protein C8R43DRAFT_1134781 [Mycena crocata]|nr:hypothetical protein C8R43DRAFT_1134781 [Mycena crocata]
MPPNTHTTPTLTRTQRVHLMRSTRKVEALLGETPLVANTTESTSTHSQYLTESHSTIPTSAHSSNSSKFRSSTRPVLFVRLPTSVSFVSDALTSPLSPTSGASLNSPVTSSTLTLAAEAEMGRRQKLGKLARTLGENVSAELVFPSNSESMRRRNRRGSSLSITGPGVLKAPLRHAVVTNHGAVRDESRDETRRSYDTDSLMTTMESNREASLIPRDASVGR